MPKWWVLHGNQFQCVLVIKQTTYGLLEIQRKKIKQQSTGKMMNEINEMLRGIFWKSSLAPGLCKYLCNLLWSLSKTLEYLVVILQDAGKHICSHFISFGEVCLQALLIHLTLKLCDDRSWFKEADSAQM